MTYTSGCERQRLKVGELDIGKAKQSCAGVESTASSCFILRKSIGGDENQGRAYASQESL